MRCHAYDDRAVLRRVCAESRPPAFRIGAAVSYALGNLGNGSLGEIVAHVPPKKNQGSASGPSQKTTNLL
ncbi:hypothetical protein ACVWW3_000401 [Bradyrhizobium sp. LM2.9]